MSRFHSYLNTASLILNAYKGDQPFNLFLKSYFSQQKKYGSRDRKQIGQLCYVYFRLGQAALEMSSEDRLLTSLFLCEQHPNEILEQLKPEWNEIIAMQPEEKASLLNFSIEGIFPWQDELSEGIDHKMFSNSFLVQPDLFLRIRPGHEERVIQKLRAADFSYNQISHSCVSLANSVQIDKIIELDKEAVVQDYNSQRVGEFFHLVQNPEPIKVYDCCAASGGKSILAYDVLRNVELTVSDIRQLILANLKKRFARAGIQNYSAFAMDLSASKRETRNAKPETFDLVICDAPCTGSGTWSRTPEQLYYFNTERIDHYSNLQQRILENVIPAVKDNGWLLYITCSVFKRENEEAVNFLINNFDLRLVKKEIMTGYDKKADTLFAALLQKKAPIS